MKCRICGSEEEQTPFILTEKKIGTFEQFEYFLCRSCNTMQIISPPEDIRKYYPGKFDSFEKIKVIPLPKIKEVIFNLRNAHLFERRTLIGGVITFFFPNFISMYLMGKRITKETRILDVGSGTGNLLYALHREGMKNLMGIDPYITETILGPEGLMIGKMTLKDLNGKWDIVMFNHSFEHEKEPVEMLKEVRRLLSPSGLCLIRTPLMNSWAWQKYRENWVQLDAPRHNFIYSEDSLKRLAGSAGFKVKQIIYDSTDFQVWGSEQYKRDIPLLSEKSLHYGRKRSIFSRFDILRYKVKAISLNKKGRGDQAAFYLTMTDNE